MTAYFDLKIVLQHFVIYGLATGGLLKKLNVLRHQVSQSDKGEP